jgi:hypothetical protein
MLLTRRGGSHKRKPAPFFQPAKGFALKPVLVTTQHRGVFAGLISEDQDVSARSMPLHQAKMAIYWGTTRGVMELAHTGPNGRTKVSLPADIPMLNDITAIFNITPEAWAKWQDA